MSSTAIESRRIGWRRLSPFRVRRTGADWIVDCVIFAVALAGWWFNGFLAIEQSPAVPGWFWPVDWSLGLLLCLALWWTRSHPLAVGILGILPGALAMTAGVAVVIVVFRLAMYARPRTAAALTVVHLVTALPYHALFPLAGMSWQLWLVMIPLIYLLALSFGLLARARRLVVDVVRAEAARDRERLEAQLARVRRVERERIAREMHDVLAHRISLVSVHAGALEFRTEPGATGAAPDAAEIHRTAGVIRQNAHLAVEELREVLSVLRDEEEPAAELHPQPRLVDLPRLLAEAERAGQLVDTAIETPERGELPDVTQRTVYRVVQEGLTNARKHAPAARVAVRVELSEDSVRVRVSNPAPVGVTAKEIPGVGAGLAGLAERLRIEAGTLEHGYAEGEFRLAAELPRRQG